MPAAERLLIFPDLELVPLPLSSAICRPGVHLRHAYFPTTSIVSLLHVMADGSTAEIAGVGNDGMVGVSIFMGGNSATNWAVVHSAGHAFRLSGALLMEQFHRSAPIQRLLMRYAQALLTQMAQTAVCNRHHSVEQHLCRWLLLSLDRLDTNEMSITQELIAQLLGVRREGVTEAAGRLQRAGLIHYSRGKIVVVDRAGLEARACECYRVVKTECDRLLPTLASGAARSKSVRTWNPPRARNSSPVAPPV